MIAIGSGAVTLPPGWRRSASRACPRRSERPTQTRSGSGSWAAYAASASTTSSSSANGIWSTVLAEFVAYYNHDRPHRTLGLETPLSRVRSFSGEVRSRPILGGLHHAYGRAA